MEQKAALSHTEYLEREFNKVKSRIRELESNARASAEELRELYFQKGKLYSDIELAQRIPSYEE
jgi:hypothetical protein